MQVEPEAVEVVQEDISSSASLISQEPERSPSKLKEPQVGTAERIQEPERIITAAAEEPEVTEESSTSTTSQHLDMRQTSREEQQVQVERHQVGSSTSQDQTVPQEAPARSSHIN